MGKETSGPRERSWLIVQYGDTDVICERGGSADRGGMVGDDVWGMSRQGGRVGLDVSGNMMCGRSVVSGI